MKNYFPFTDYDFYAYLTSGGLLFAVIDYTLNDATFLTRTDWSFIQIMIAVSAAYVAGHIVATFAQAMLESFVASKLIAKPMQLQLAFKHPNLIEKAIGAMVGRYYEPLPEATRKSIRESAATDLKKPVEEVTDAEDVFLVGFRKSFAVEGARSRIDDFRNQYGFCRNISFVAFVGALLLSWKAWTSACSNADWALASTAGLVSVLMFVRFVKFLSSFQSEVIRLVK